MLSPRLIAIQGFGGSVRQVALQGLWPSTSPVVGGAGVDKGTFKARMRALDAEDESLLFIIAVLAATGRLH